MNKLTSKHIMLVISMCGVIGVVLGFCSNVTGVFFTPIAEEFGIGKGSVSLTLTICSLVMAFTGMISSKVINRNNFRKMLMIMLGTIAASTAALAFCTNIMMMYVFQALRGAACGIIGLVMVTPIINHWFCKSNGLFTSICVGFSGLTGAVFSPVMTSIIQSAGWRAGYLACAAVIVVFSLPAVFFPIAMYPEDAGTQCYGIRPEEASSGSKKESSGVPAAMFLLTACYAALACYGTAMPQHFPGIAESFSLSASIGALMVSTAMVCNTGGKVLLGILIDAIGCRLSCLLFLAGVTAGGLCMLMIHNTAGMFLGAALIGLSYSLGSVGTALVVKDVFGEEKYSSVYPKVALFTTLSNSLATSLIGVLYDSSGTYNSGLLSVSVFAAVSIGLLIICYRKKA